MAEKLLILGAGIMQIPVIRKAVEMGFEVIVADFDDNAPGRNFAHSFYPVSTLDKEGILKIASEENISGILTTSDAPVKTVAYVAAKLDLPSMSEAVSEICTDKYRQRMLFQENSINCPEFHLCGKNSDLSCFNRFPYIVKPVDSSASRGVTKVENMEELLNAVEEALKFSRSGKILIESFIPGREFSVETLTQNGKTHIITITEKLTKGEIFGFFVEDTHIQPARIKQEERRLIEDEVIKAIKAIGIDNCPTHTEVKINSEGAFIIEIACRLGGDYITSDLVPLSTGVDMLENLIRISTGKTIETNASLEKASAVQFLNPENYNRCLEYVRRNPDGLTRFEISDFKNISVKNSMDRLGYIILQKDNISELEKELEHIK